MTKGLNRLTLTGDDVESAEIYTNTNNLKHNWICLPFDNFVSRRWLPIAGEGR